MGYRHYTFGESHRCPGNLIEVDKSHGRTIGAVLERAGELDSKLLAFVRLELNFLLCECRRTFSAKNSVGSMEDDRSSTTTMSTGLLHWHELGGSNKGDGRVRVLSNPKVYVVWFWAVRNRCGFAVCWVLTVLYWQTLPSLSSHKDSIKGTDSVDSYSSHWRSN